MNEAIDITPEDSVTPIYLAEETQDSIDSRKKDLKLVEDIEKAKIAKEEAMASAIEKLRVLGLSEEEAKAIAGV